MFGIDIGFGEIAAVVGGATTLLAKIKGLRIIDEVREFVQAAEMAENKLEYVRATRKAAEEDGTITEEEGRRLRKAEDEAIDAMAVALKEGRDVYRAGFKLLGRGKKK